MDTNEAPASGPLARRRIVELGGIGPVPFCGMLLADMGAEVVRIDRSAERDAVGLSGKYDVLRRGKRSIMLDLKSPDGHAAARDLILASDAVIEGFRPGVAERLGLGPDALMTAAPGLVYGRLTGWGQSGPLAHDAGHDINYIALSGVLSLIGPAGERPIPPLNLVGDMGGGAMFLAFGLVAAMLERERSGLGQVVDAAIVDGAAYLGSLMYALAAAGTWSPARGSNVVDTGSPWYDSYPCSDGAYIAIGPGEPQFRREFVRLVGLDEAAVAQAEARGDDAALRAMLTARFTSRSRADWQAVFEGTNACASAVLSPAEAPQHPHNVARATFATVGGVTQPAPAPRFSRSGARSVSPPREVGADTATVLASLRSGA